MSADTPSRPLPRITVDQPSAERGADDTRAHLDSLNECVFSGDPVPADESKVKLDKFGTFVWRYVSKAHLDHPESWKHAVHQQSHADKMLHCESCGEITTSPTDGLCNGCWRVENA